MEKELNSKEKAKAKAYSRSKKSHQGKNNWHVNKRSSVIVCKFCETKIPMWKNPKYCPYCLEGK